MTAAAPGVTLGYLAAAGIITSLWLGWGILLLPLVILLAVLHGIAAWHSLIPLPASHHHWLAWHHIWTLIGLGAVLLLPLAAVPELVRAGETIINTLQQAPKPLQTLAAAQPELINWPSLVHNGLMILFIWFCLLLWLSIRLLRRGLRWAEKHSADP